MIFISVASYLDPMMLFTINDAMVKADNPELLRFGLVDQNPKNQRKLIDKLYFRNQVRYVHVQPTDTLGVSWARSLAFSLYDGEGFLLQIDSHMLFEQSWDTVLRQELNRLLGVSIKPILTTYPYRFDFVSGVPTYTPSDNQTALVLRPHPATPLSSSNCVLRFEGRHVAATSPVLGCHIAAGFFFCSGSFIEEVPYDPYLYFHGEEQSLALRAYTRGWDIYHPVYTPLYHLYKSENTSHEAHHWFGQVNERRVFSSTYLTQRSQERLTQLVSHGSLPGAFGLGSLRTLHDYKVLSGIDYLNRVITEVT